MGRPQKQTVDYFPHFVGKVSKTKDVLHSKWGNDGYAFWFKLLEILGSSEGHYYDCSKVLDWEYLVSVMKVDNQTATDIMEYLAEAEKIDPELWREHKIIWCQRFVDNLRGLYDKRQVLPTKPFSEPSETQDGPEAEEPETIETTEPEQETTEPEEKPKPKPKEDKRVQYAQYVKMTEEEHERLVTRYGEADTARLIEILDNYKGSKGKQYKNDYRAILSWCVDRLKEEKAKGGNRRNDNNQPSPTTFTASTGFRG